MFGARSQYELADLLVVHLRQRLHYAYLQDDVTRKRPIVLAPATAAPAVAVRLSSSRLVVRCSATSA